MLDSSAPIRCRRGRGVEMPAGVAAASDETGRGVPGPTTGRPGVLRRGGVGAAGADVHGDGGDGDGEGTPSRRRRKLEPELASAPDRGLDAQPVLIPDRGLDGLAVRGWSVELETPVLHALKVAAPARVAAKSTTSS